MIHTPLDHKFLDFNEYYPGLIGSRPPAKLVNRNPIFLPEKGLANTGILEKNQKRYTLFDEVSYIAEAKADYKNKKIYKGKYLDPRSDFGAKKIFENEILLKSFFNHLLKGYTTINEVYATPTEALGETKEDKSVIFDLSFRNEKGERFLLEMQKQRQTWFMDRSQYYTTFAIRDQVLKGTCKYKFKRIYSIGILNFNLEK